MENDVHPKRKRPVGERLALLARNKVYGEDLISEAPEVDSVYRDEIEVRFAWTAYVEVNLYSNGGLPVKPFKRVV